MSVELIEESRVQDVVAWYPRPLLGTEPLPIYEVLQVAVPPPGVEDLLDLVDAVSEDLGLVWRGRRFRFCGGRRNWISVTF